MTVVRLTTQGLHRVLDGTEGMTFIVDHFSEGERGKVAHVRDYRRPGTHYPYQIWSIARPGYEVIEPDKTTENVVTKEAVVAFLEKVYRESDHTGSLTFQDAISYARCV